MRAVLYIRVSTDMQAEEGYSIDAQRTKLISFASSQDWQIVDIYVDDGYSAKDLNRPQMQAILSDMQENKFDVVLVYKLDRLTRSVLDLHKLLNEFDKYNVKFKSATEVFETTTAMGRFFITLVGAMASWERETISERVRFAMEQMVLEGKRPGGAYPYGYDKDGSIVPEEASLIREIRKHYLSGMGYMSVAKHMNAQQKLRRGIEWGAATVAYTLENPFYAGTIRLGSKNKDGVYVNHNRDERVNCIYGEGTHDPIFTKEEYDEHRNFAKRKSGGGYSRQKVYWFSGVLRCGRCGAAMFGKLDTKRTRKSGETVRNPYYICANRHEGRVCDMPVFRQKHVEHLLFSFIQQTTIDRDVLREQAAAIESQTKDRDDELRSLQRELARIPERKSKWQTMFVDGLIDRDKVKLRIQEETTREQELIDMIAQLQRMSAAIPKVDEMIYLEEIWEEATDEEKKDITFAMFKRIVINTNLSNVKGVKNRFFDAWLESVEFN